MYLIYNVHLVGIKKKWLAARMHGVESFKVICYPRLHLFDCYECLARNARNERRNACTICLYVKCPLKTVIRQESWVPLWYNMAFRSQSGEFMHTELQWRAVKDTLRVCKGTGRGGGQRWHGDVTYCPTATTWTTTVTTNGNVCCYTREYTYVLHPRRSHEEFS